MALRTGNVGATCAVPEPGSTNAIRLTDPSTLLEIHVQYVGTTGYQRANRQAGQDSANRARAFARRTCSEVRCQPVNALLGRAWRKQCDGGRAGENCRRPESAARYAVRRLERAAQSTFT